MSKISSIERLRSWLYRIEDTVLIALLLLMILMAALQIFLRNFFDSGIAWGDTLVRILVLWVGLFGAMVASRKGEHIKIDLIARYLPNRVNRVVHMITEFFTAAVSAVVVFYGYRFVKFEFEDGFTAFASVPAWLCVAIIPFSFAVISLRYTLQFLDNLLQLVRARP